MRLAIIPEIVTQLCNRDGYPSRRCAAYLTNPLAPLYSCPKSYHRN